MGYLGLFHAYKLELWASWELTYPLLIEVISPPFASGFWAHKDLLPALDQHIQYKILIFQGVV